MNFLNQLYRPAFRLSTRAYCTPKPPKIPKNVLAEYDYLNPLDMKPGPPYDKKPFRITLKKGEERWKII